MITNFKIFENTNNPIFSVIIDNEKYIFSLSKTNEINILLDNELYQTLSITIPDTRKLDNNMFFIDPTVKKEIIDVLIEENFIEKTDIKSIAGDKETTAYKLLLSL
jgi:hypothetical protein